MRINEIQLMETYQIKKSIHMKNYGQNLNRKEINSVQRQDKFEKQQLREVNL